jgi:hypothetical protein
VRSKKQNDSDHRSPTEYLKYDAFILAMKFNDAALPNRQILRRFVCQAETGGCMPLITFRSFEQDLQKARAEGYRIAEQQILQQIAEALRPSVLRGVATEQWPPAFVNILVHHIIAQWNEVQFELQQVYAECARLKQVEADLRADPIRAWLREAQAAEQTAQRRADQSEAEVTRLTQRLEAEQRARESEVSERDRKIVDLNRLLARYHLEQVPDADAPD